MQIGVETAAPSRADAAPESRLLGHVSGQAAGPTLLCIGGIHGNEPAGVLALQRVLGDLRAGVPDLKGDFMAVAGNVAALAQGRRYIDRDLNRSWTEGGLARLRDGGADSEDREQIELLEMIEQVIRDARGPVYVVDLHTTSGRGGVFSTFGDSLANRDFAGRVPVPMVLGLEELVEGTLLAHLSSRGVVAVAIETGQHEEPEAIERAVAVLRVLIGAAGLVPAGSLPGATPAWKRLQAEARGLPKVMEMRHRHDIAPGDGFRMSPGFRNFQPVERGHVVGHDQAGPVTAPENGRILMPLYQEQGQDGFFLVREFAPAWLWLSATLRRLGVDRWAHRLPGVRLDGEDHDRIVVETRIARWYAVQFFHLLGFRRQEEIGTRLVLSRQARRTTER